MSALSDPENVDLRVIADAQADASVAAHDEETAATTGMTDEEAYALLTRRPGATGVREPPT